MDWLDAELKSALARKNPPADFAARVTDAASRHRLSVMPRWLPAAAAILIIAGGSGIAYREHQGRVAKEQVMLAMRITAAKLDHIQSHIHEARQ